MLRNSFWVFQRNLNDDLIYLQYDNLDIIIIIFSILGDMRINNVIMCKVLSTLGPLSAVPGEETRFTASTQ